jgi:DNA phosphorothioation-associated putative methyltransferase
VNNLRVPWPPDILPGMAANELAIPRHKTAIRRADLSRPMRCALEDGLIDAAASVFDYGCGHGQDIALLQERGIACAGWDPVFRPAAPIGPADVVNLGFVLNVIEGPEERTATLRRAWELCRRLLVVAAQVRVAERGRSEVEFGDGVLTGRGTFQKFYTQDELRTYLEAELGTEAVPAALGVFYVFKDEAARQQFLANRFRRRAAAPRPRRSVQRFEENRDLLEPFQAAVADLGRLPHADEFPQADAVAARFGSLARAFALVRRVTGPAEWEAVRRRRTEDLLVYLALARFRKRPALGRLPRTLQRDFRAFFGTYTRACRQADELLFQAGDAEAIDAACQRSPVGKLLPNALYVHRSALDQLEPLLRVYEGCGRAYLGEVEGANVLKLHRFSGKLSYLVYPDFDTDPHPAWLRCVKLSLRTRQLECYDYAASDNPPVLHRKETFLHPEHPLRAKFARLTEQEERHGLLDEPATIGTRAGWQARLAAAGFALRSHRLVKSHSGSELGTPAMDGSSPRPVE